MAALRLCARATLVAALLPVQPVASSQAPPHNHGAALLELDASASLSLLQYSVLPRRLKAAPHASQRASPECTACKAECSLNFEVELNNCLVALDCEDVEGKALETCTTHCAKQTQKKQIDCLEDCGCTDEEAEAESEVAVKVVEGEAEAEAEADETEEEEGIPQEVVEDEAEVAEGAAREAGDRKRLVAHGPSR